MILTQIPSPSPLISIRQQTGLRSGQIEGQRALNSAISQMHKKYIEFSTQAHQFITHKVGLPPVIHCPLAAPDERR